MSLLLLVGIFFALRWGRKAWLQEQQLDAIRLAEREELRRTQLERWKGKVK